MEGQMDKSESRSDLTTGSASWYRRSPFAYDETALTSSHTIVCSTTGTVIAPGEVTSLGYDESPEPVPITAPRPFTISLERTPPTVDRLIEEILEDRASAWTKLATL